jgi:hypothetical protein
MPLALRSPSISAREGSTLHGAIRVIAIDLPVPMIASSLLETDP